MTLAVPSVIVKDQDEQGVNVTDVYRGFDAVVVHIEIDKPPAPISDDDAVMAIAAALLGTNLVRDVRLIAQDIAYELHRMGYKLITTEPKRT
jgi:hypothetical protein